MIHRSGSVGQHSLPRYLGLSPSLQPGESEIVGAVGRLEKTIREFENHRCSRKLCYFNLFEFFDHTGSKWLELKRW